jgi:hypothetical protein
MRWRIPARNAATASFWSGCGQYHCVDIRFFQVIRHRVGNAVDFDDFIHVGAKAHNGSSVRAAQETDFRLRIQLPQPCHHRQGQDDVADVVGPADQDMRALYWHVSTANSLE